MRNNVFCHLYEIGSFPTLCEEIRAVGSGENEVIFAEEKFIEAEPPRLDDIKSLKGWFIEDVELLELIHRQGELLFQKNRTDEALEIFLFLQSVTDVESAMYKQVRNFGQYHLLPENLGFVTRSHRE